MSVLNIDVDRLIELVEDRPLLWDKTVEGHRNRDLTKPAWDQICRIMYRDRGNYDALSEDQKKIVSKMISSKWTKIRDVWQKTYKKRRENEMKGVTCRALKDPARHEKLKFLEKVYDPEENEIQQQIMIDPDDQLFKKMGIVDPDAETVLNYGVLPRDGTNQYANAFCRQFVDFMKKNIEQPKAFMGESPNKKRKIENPKQMSKLLNQRQSAKQPMIINVGNTPKKAITNAANRILYQRQSLHPKDGNQASSFVETQLGDFKREPLCSTNHNKRESSLGVSKNTTTLSIKTEKNVELHTPTQHLKNEKDFKPKISDQREYQIKEKISTPQIKTENDIEPSISKLHEHSGVENLDLKPDKPDIKSHLKQKEPDENDTLGEEEFQNLISFMRPHVMQFKKSRILDFQIEFLQLVKKLKN